MFSYMWYKSQCFFVLLFFFRKVNVTLTKNMLSVFLFYSVREYWKPRACHRWVWTNWQSLWYIDDRSLFVSSNPHVNVFIGWPIRPELESVKRFRVIWHGRIKNISMSEFSWLCMRTDSPVLVPDWQSQFENTFLFIKKIISFLYVSLNSFYAWLGFVYKRKPKLCMLCRCGNKKKRRKRKKGSYQWSSLSVIFSWPPDGKPNQT